MRTQTALLLAAAAVLFVMNPVLAFLPAASAPLLNNARHGLMTPAASPMQQGKLVNRSLPDCIPRINTRV